MPTRSIRVWAPGAGCDKKQLLVATVVAYGYGPNLTGTGTAPRPHPAISGER